MNHLTGADPQPLLFYAKLILTRRATGVCRASLKRPPDDTSKISACVADMRPSCLVGLLSSGAEPAIIDRQDSAQLHPAHFRLAFA